MKQTNTALTFMNSSYQAVFKHAYFAGIASSFAMLAVSPYAVAADNTWFGSTENNLNKVDIGPSVTKNQDYNAWAKYINVYGGNAVLNIQAKTTPQNLDTTVRFVDGVTVSNGVVNVSGSDSRLATLIGSKNANTPIQGYMQFTDRSELNINLGKVSVNKADFTSSTINISGLTNYQGHPNQEIYNNYSYLRTGALAEKYPGEAGAATFNNVTLNLGDYSAIDAMGDVTITSGYININAAKDTDGVKKNLGEIAAKAIIKANEFNITSTNSSSNLVVNNNAGGGVFANKVNLDKAGKLIIKQGGQLQMAGKLNLKTGHNDTPAENGSALDTSTAIYLGTEYGAGELNITGSISNSGELLLGANSVPRGTSTTYNYFTNQYTVTQNSGSVDNIGTIKLGDNDVGEKDTLDTSSGATTYILNSGSFANKGQLLINQGSKLELNNGSFENTGTVVLNSGSSMSVVANAVKGRALPYSITTGERVAKLNLDSLGNIDAKSGSSIELKDGVFTAVSHNTNLGKVILDSLRKGEDLTAADWIVNDATLQLDSDISLSNEIISGSGIKGMGNAILATTGKLDFTSESTNNLGELNGFNKLVGADVTIHRASDDPLTTSLDDFTNTLYSVNTYEGLPGGEGDGENEIPPIVSGELPTVPDISNKAKIWLNNTTEFTKTIAATKSLRTSDASMLAVGSNVVLELTTDQFDSSVDSTQAAIDRKPVEHHVDIDLELATGGKLLVSADPWVAHNITSASGSSLQIISTAQNLSAAKDFKTFASLRATNLYLDGDVLVDGSGTLSASGDIVLGQNSVATINNGSSLDAKNLYLGGNITFDSSTSNVGTIVAASGSTLQAMNGTKITLNNALLNVDSQLNLSSNTELTVKSLNTVIPDSSNLASDGQHSKIELNSAKLNITGDGDTTTTDLTANINLSNGSTLNLGKALDTIGLKYDTESSKFSLNNDFKLLTSNGSTIQIDLSGVASSELSQADRDSLFNAILNEDSKDNFFSLSGSTSSDIEVDEDGHGNKTIDFANLTHDQEGNLDFIYDDDTTRNAILTNVDTTKTLAGGFKAVETTGVTKDGIQVGASKNLNIYGTTQEGNLIANADGEAVGAKLHEDAKLNLASSGKIGDILGSGLINISSGQNINVVASTEGSTVSKIEGKELVNEGNLTVGEVVVASLLGTNSSVTAKTISADSTELSNSKITATTYNANGNFKATNSSSVNISGTLTLQGGMQVDGGANVFAEKLLAVSGDIAVGTETTAKQVGTHGSLVANKLDLNGNSLILDPEFGQKTATAFIQSFADLDSTTASGSSDLMNLNGNVIVGRNSALGLGGDEADFRAALATHQDANGSLKKDGIGALAYINQANVALNNNKLIVGTEDVAKLKEIASGSDSIYLGQGAGLQVGVKALSQVRQNQALVFSDLDSGDTIKVDGGTLIVPANIKNEEIATIFGKEVNLSLAEGQVLKVTTDNGVYTGVIDTASDLHGSGDFTLTLNANSRNILSRMSDPTYDYFIDKMSSNAVLPEEAQNSNNTETVQNFAYDFITAAGSEGDGAALEHSARLAGLGATAQVAHQVSQAGNNAMMQRATANSTTPASQDANMAVVGNSQSAVWFNPLYQDFSAENFAADNLSYGADIDLYGVAAGFDHTLSNGVKLGAMVNAGKGDATGTGLGAGVKNDFSYYGAGLYANFKPSENSSLIADVSYTSVDNDLSSESNLKEFGKITGSTKSNALSAGVTAEYTVKAGALNITPHVGARYTRLDLDNYDVKVDGTTVAHTESETANVFSVPVGVRLSADITNGDWSIQPSADFTITSNFGDDAIKSSTEFDQQSGIINYNTELMDSFTYGAKVGIQISNGNFSIGADAGYIKSSNTDELSFGAKAVLKF